MSNILLCGVGGQGTVLASKLIAFAAMEKGQKIRTSETIGMSQRGGCVVSHVRTGEEIASPMVPKGGADVLIAFEPGEAVRNLSYLKKEGVVIVNKKAVKPVTASLTGSDYDGSEMLEYLKVNVPGVCVIDGEEICKKCGSAKVLNIALLAAAAKSGQLGITTDELKNAIIKRIPERFHELNLKAVALASGE
ncbi:MAG: indolepyruvate oxidoreductase subunit beta [Ruminococcus sp.]|nr:indolepyruvate oxidoreductase subunit beta [Ruminococcus sp.]